MSKVTIEEIKPEKKQRDPVRLVEFGRGYYRFGFRLSRSTLHPAVHSMAAAHSEDKYEYDCIRAAGYGGMQKVTVSELREFAEGCFALADTLEAAIEKAKGL